MSLSQNVDRVAMDGIQGPAGNRSWYLSATPLATVPWLIGLRLATAAIEALIVVIVWTFAGADLPLDHLWILLTVGAAANVAIAMLLSAGRRVPRAFAAAVLAVEIVLLTGLLELTGGPWNPFSVVYLVQITVAVLTLGKVWGSLLGGLAVACYAILTYWHARELVPGHHRINDFPTHLFTMWISAAVTAELIAYFVVKVSDALTERERQLQAMRVRAARTERLVSLTTLAAGAAHELSTPLATIALAARELEHALTTRGTVPDLAEDVQLIRGEVDRCRTILDQMSGRAGGIAADDPELVDTAMAIAEVRDRLPPEQATRLQVRLPEALQPLWIAQGGFVQAILSLVKNAFDATDDDTLPVVVEVHEDGGLLRVTVQDRGRGLTAEAAERAGDPFYTTKEPGRGLGLGLFLARVFAERSGGALTLHSDNGTTAVLELPRSPELAPQS